MRNVKGERPYHKLAQENKLPDPLRDCSNNLGFKRVKIVFAGFLKRLWAKALEKAGVSATGCIYSIPTAEDVYFLYSTGKRVVLVQRDKLKFAKGDIIRITEQMKASKHVTGRECHFFIKDILPEGSPGLKAGFCVLTLE